MQNNGAQGDQKSKQHNSESQPPSLFLELQQLSKKKRKYITIYMFVCEKNVIGK